MFNINIIIYYTELIKLYLILIYFTVYISSINIVLKKNAIFF